MNFGAISIDFLLHINDLVRRRAKKFGATVGHLFEDPRKREKACYVGHLRMVMTRYPNFGHRIEECFTYITQKKFRTTIESANDSVFADKKAARTLGTFFKNYLTTLKEEEKIQRDLDKFREIQIPEVINAQT